GGGVGGERGGLERGVEAEVDRRLGAEAAEGLAADGGEVLVDLGAGAGVVEAAQVEALLAVGAGGEARVHGPGQREEVGRAALERRGVVERVRAGRLAAGPREDDGESSGEDKTR